jgi:hypothetical protein
VLCQFTRRIGLCIRFFFTGSSVSPRRLLRNPRMSRCCQFSEGRKEAEAQAVAPVLRTRSATRRGRKIGATRRAWVFQQSPSLPPPGRLPSRSWLQVLVSSYLHVPVFPQGTSRPPKPRPRRVTPFTTRPCWRTQGVGADADMNGESSTQGLVDSRRFTPGRWASSIEVV